MMMRCGWLGSVNDAEPTIDYGTSELYTQEDLEEGNDDQGHLDLLTIGMVNEMFIKTFVPGEIRAFSMSERKGAP